MSDIRQDVLDAIAVLEPDACGMTILHRLEEIKVKASIAGIYITAQHLEEEGWIRSEPRPGANYRTKLYWSLTGKRIDPNFVPNLVPKLA